MQQALIKVLQNLDWAFEQLNGTTIITGFQGNLAAFTFFIFTSDEGIIFTSYANLTPIPEDQALDLAFLLARLNFENSFAKFSFDDQNRIVLSLEIPTTSLSDAMVQAALQTICLHTEKLYDRFPQFQAGSS